MSVAYTWGTRPEERAAVYPCDRVLESCDRELFRGVTVNAPPATLYRWLCQLRVAPYSYDWIDNRGRRSPRRLTPGLEELAVGQTIMTVFELASFEPPRHLTARLPPGSRAARWFGEIAVTYWIEPLTADVCRLLAKLRVRDPAGPLRRPLRLLLPWGDLLMMRRQLLNLKRLAERRPA